LSFPRAAALPLPLLFLAALAAGSPAAGNGSGPDAPRVLSGKLSGTTRVSGTVRVADDVTVLPGATLAAAPGTVFEFEPTDSTKVDPEYFLGGVEMVVRGELRADRTAFRFAGRTGGIVVDGGRARLEGGEISGAEAGLTVLRGGEASAGKGLAVRDCREGMVLFPGGRLSAEGGGVRASGNGVGLVLMPGAGPPPAGVALEGNEDAGSVAWDAPGNAPSGAAEPRPPPRGAATLGDTFVDADRTLSGDVVVDGVIRVSPGATLTLAPGTRLFFTFRDTDGDGIGENGLFLQGNLRARGTPSRRIGFLPAGGGSGRGLWDAVNFMASDQGENVLEHVDIEGGYRGLHAHFSRLSATDVRIARCFRGMQFQESEVSLGKVSVRDSASVLRGRDSTVRIEGLAVRDVVTGVNLFRSSVELSGIDVADAGFYGIRLRDSRSTVRGGRLLRAFLPLSVQEGSARVAGVAAEEPGLSGFSLVEGDVTMEDCSSTGSRVDGISATRAKAALSGGGISGYGRDAVRLAGPAELLLKGVKLVPPRGGGNIPIHDGKVVPGLGIVRIE
jgi:hypothetical protein